MKKKREKKKNLMCYLAAPMGEESRQGPSSVSRLWLPQVCYLGMGQGCRHPEPRCKRLLADTAPPGCCPQVCFSATGLCRLRQSKRGWRDRNQAFSSHLVLEGPSCHSCRALPLRKAQLTLEDKESHRRVSARRAPWQAAAEAACGAGRHSPCWRQ